MKAFIALISSLATIAAMLFMGASPATTELNQEAIGLAKEIHWSSKDKAIVTPSGSLPVGHPFSFFIPQPWNDDFYTDNYICFPVPAELYPNGIRIKRFGGAIDSALITDTVQMKYWDASNDNASFAANDVTTLIFDKKIQAINASLDIFIPANTLLYLDLPSSKKIRWLSVWGYYDVCSPPVTEVKK